MFGLWEDEEEQQDPQDEIVQEFDFAAQSIIEQSPDADTGLAAMRDLYTEYGLTESQRAQELLESRSTELRQKFDVHTKYDFDETVQHSPVPMSTIQLDKEYEDENEKNIALINKWEETNLSAFDESQDTINIQNRSKYKRDVQKAATALRREVYGAEDYIVEGGELKYSPSWGSVIGDTALSAGQGLVGGAASLVGADSVNDWFEEGISEGYAENHPYLAGVASGAGTAVGAVGAGLATTLTTGTPIGAAGYLGVSGAGSVREQVEESLESGGTTGEAVVAGTIEGVSQAAQAAVGGKVFGKVAGQVLGKAAPTLGAKVFPRVTGNAVGRIGVAAVSESVTEGAGQVASNVATNIGQGTDVPLTQGVGVAAVAGGLVGGAASGVGEGAAKVRSKADNTAVDESGLTDASKEALEEGPGLATVIEENEGAPPSPREGVREPTRPVNLTDPATVVVNEDGSELVIQDGRLHIKKGDVAVEAHDSNFFVTPEIKAQLNAIPNTPDGAGVHLVERNGKLYAETVQPFLKYDPATGITIDPNGAGATSVEIPTTERTRGTFHIGTSKVRDENGLRRYKYDIAPTPVKDVSTAGAAFAGRTGTLHGKPLYGLGQRESATAKRIRERLGNELAERVGAATISYEQNADGTRTEVVNPTLLYWPTTHAAMRSEAETFIAERGIVQAMSELSSLDSVNKTHTSAVTLLRNNLEVARANAFNNRADPKAAEELQIYETLLSEMLPIEAHVTNLAGTALKGTQAIEGPNAASGKILDIMRGLETKAEAEVSAEVGRPVTIAKAKEDVKRATETVAQLEKDFLFDEIDKKEGELQATYNLITESKNADIDAEVQRYEKAVQQLRGEETAAVENIRRGDKEHRTEIQGTITGLEEELASVEGEIAKIADTPENPYKKDVETEKRIVSEIDEARKTKSEIHAKLLPLEGEPVKNKPNVKRAEQSAEEARTKVAELEKQLEEVTKNPVSESAKQELADLRDRLRKARSERSQKENARKKALEQTGPARVALHQAQKELARAKEDHNEVRVRLDDLKARIESAKDDTSVTADGVKDLKKELATTERDFAVKQKKEAQLAKQEEVARSKLDKLIDEERRYAHSIEEHESAIKTLTKDITTTEDKVKSSRNNVEELRDSIREAKSTLHEREKEHKDIKREAEKLRGQLAATERKIREREDSLKDVRNNIESRIRLKKDVPESLLQRAARLKRSIEDTKEVLRDRERRESQDIKTRGKVAVKRSEAAKVLSEIRRLKKQRKAPKEETNEQKRIKKALEDLKTKRKEGVPGARLTREQRDQYTRAKTEEQKAKDREARLQAKIDKKAKQFPVEMQERLRELYGLQATVTSPSGRVRIDDEILSIDAKFSEPTKEAVDRIWTYWRKNVLSGVETAFRNMTTVSNLVSTTASYAVGDVVRVAKGKPLYSQLYVQGIREGLKKKGWKEAGEIIAGRRGGRLQLGDSGGKRQPVRSLKTGTRLNPFDPLLDIAEVMHRGLGAMDALIYHSAEGGQYRVAAAMLELQGKPATVQAVDGILYPGKAETEAAVRKNAAAMRSVGIELSSKEEDLMVQEAFELKRSDALRAIAEKHGLENTFMNKTHPTVLGLIAKGITTITHGVQIPYTNVHPLKMVVPFVNTAANIGDMWLAHTPLGLGRYAGIKFQQGKLRAENAKGAAEAKRQGKEFTPEVDTFELAAQEQLGRMVLGSAAIGMVWALLAGQDEEKPWIRFNGRPDPKQRRTLQEQGIPPFSLQIGDKIITKEVLGPLTLAFAFADNINQSVKRGTDLQTTLTNTALLSAGAVSELSFLPAVSEFFQMLEGSQGFEADSSPTTMNRFWNTAGQRAAGIAQGFIPASGLLRNIYKWYDGDPQETYNNLWAKFANNIPGAVEAVGAPNKLNRFGEPIKLDITKRLPTGVFMSRVLEDPVSSWMQTSGYKITDQGPMIKLNKGERDTYEEYRQAVGKYRDTLDEVESRRVLEVSGPQIKAYLAGLAADPAYSTFSEEGQKEIHREVARIRAEAREQVLGGG